ncbi:antibiotic biosynthesis monooxygenase family protein [Actinokineospora sp.]|uniref:antibiotic biosynthesis monooxygenase family protein n=1 Tax=Actinokineospora sp. TaxID=1872133 RepID=UPI004037D12C
MIFEYWFDPAAPELFDEYLRESDQVREVLTEIEGFRGVERFESSGTPGKFVAIGFFDDEAAVTRWRNRPEHRRVQGLGRGRLFTDYRLRMAEVIRDYGPKDRNEAPRDSRQAHD